MVNNTPLVKDSNSILSDMLKTIKSGLIDIGVANPMVDPNSDIYVTCTALSNELAIAANNVLAQADQVMPDTASETDLDRLLTIYGLQRRGASVGSGAVQIKCSIPTLVTPASQLVSATGLVYQVTVGGTYNNLDNVPIVSVDTGAGVNLEIGSVLSWVSTPAFAQSTTILTSAVTGAVDAENDETARQRLMDRLANPPTLGNWQQVCEVCEAADPAVQKSFVYPCANGPSTFHIALTAYPTTTSVSRELGTVQLGQISSIILGQLPEYIETTITTVSNVTNDVSFKLLIPYPAGSITSGIGGGWLDPVPFPQADSSAPFYCCVSGITSSSIFIIKTWNTSVYPIAGSSRISWIDKSNNFTVQTSTITSFLDFGTAGSPAYRMFYVTVDKPFPSIALNDYIFPAMNNAQTYVNAVINWFANNGPGEKTDVSTLLPRATRKPRSNTSYPNYLDGTLLKALFNSASEIESCDFYYRQFTVAPDLPSYISDPPNIYTPNNIGFYPENL